MIKLSDCSKIDVDFLARQYFGGPNIKSYDNATKWLGELSKHSIQDNKLFKFTNSHREVEPIVYTNTYGEWWTGRYIGSLTFQGKSLEIQPRFGLEFVVSNIPLNNFKPIDAKTKIESGGNSIFLLQSLLWLNMLTKAARHTLPVVKEETQHLSEVIRGRIDVKRTVRQWAKEQRLIATNTSSKNIHNSITTLIVLAFNKIQKWFPNHNLLKWLPETVELRLNQMIAVTPRHIKEPKAIDIRRARLSNLSKSYIPLANLSLHILKNKGFTENVSDDMNNSFLLDVAELWEIYVLDVLREASPPYVEIIHGTNDSDDYLIKNLLNQEHGKLKPDFIYKRHDEIIELGDAKYKRLGDAPWMSPKRDDLYQMAAYLSKYSNCKRSTLYYPKFEENDCDMSKNNPWYLAGGQEINFLTLPVNKSEAVKLLNSQYEKLIVS